MGIKRYARCKKCKEWHFIPHKCADEWWVIEEEQYPDGPNDDFNIDDLPTARGSTIAEAAEKHAKNADSNGDYEYAIAGYGEMWLSNEKNPEWVKVFVEVRSEPIYRAVEVKE